MPTDNSLTKGNSPPGSPRKRSLQSRLKGMNVDNETLAAQGERRAKEQVAISALACRCHRQLAQAQVKSALRSDKKFFARKNTLEPRQSKLAARPAVGHPNSTPSPQDAQSSSNSRRRMTCSRNSTLPIKNSLTEIRKAIPRESSKWKTKSQRCALASKSSKLARSLYRRGTRPLPAARNQPHRGHCQIWPKSQLKN